VHHRLLLSGVSGKARLVLPAERAVVVGTVPEGGTAARERTTLRIDGIVVDDKAGAS
jgi:hypothetical protein